MLQEVPGKDGTHANNETGRRLGWGQRQNYQSALTSSRIPNFYRLFRWVAGAAFTATGLHLKIGDKAHTILRELAADILNSL
ncbi:hypothetical protein ALP73_200023 [Pseudomonas coronafaciens pv. garcae]|nr:hypothetical protein ALP73_200023 [Pseudomonas coronafaciens pv. garcae]